MVGGKGGFGRAMSSRLSIKRVRSVCKFATVAIMAAIASAQPTEAPKLSIGPVAINGSAGQVTFRAIYSGQSPPSAAAQQKYWYQTLDQSYVVVVDPGKIAPLSEHGFGEFTFEACVRQGDQTWYSYNVVATPTGTFADVQKDVNFTVGSGAQSTVSINLPLHSTNYSGALQWMADDPPAAVVPVSASQGPVITLQNNLEGLSIHVSRIGVVKENCPQCWRESEQPPIAPLSAGEKVYPALNLRPKPLSALWSTVSSLKPGATQDLLTVVVDYSVDEGGSIKQLYFNLPVRFTPSFWQLTIVVVAGTILGIALAEVLVKITAPAKKTEGARANAAARTASANPRKSLGATASRGLMTMFLTVVAVGFLVLLASYDSKLVILGLDMDPRQMIPAFIVAALIAGGSPVRTWASGIIGWGRGKTDGAEGG
jgi:hypothetical protein